MGGSDMNRRMVLALGVAVAAVAAPALAQDDITVGVSWSNFQEERWKRDEGAIRAVLDAAGAAYISTDAQSSSAKQLSDVESLIAQGADVLIVLAQDTQAIIPAVQAAADEGIPVLGYDRLIEDDALGLGGECPGQPAHPVVGKGPDHAPPGQKTHLVFELPGQLGLTGPEAEPQDTVVQQSARIGVGDVRPKVIVGAQQVVEWQPGLVLSHLDDRRQRARVVAKPARLVAQLPKPPVHLRPGRRG